MFHWNLESENEKGKGEHLDYVETMDKTREFLKKIAFLSRIFKL